MPIIINGNNTPTAGAVGYGNGTELAFSAAGSAGNILLSGGSGAPTWSSLGSGVATWLSTPSSANLAAAVTDETGSGSLVFGTNPTISGATLSGTVTLSGGTANGVVYLNASKQATSGTALTFDGSRLGVNVASPTLNFEVGGNNATAYLHSGVSVMSFGTKNNYPISFDTNNIERMRLNTLGELCVSTNTAAFSAANRGNVTIGGTTSILSFRPNGVNSGYLFHDGTNMLFDCQTAGYIAFNTNTSERVRIDSSGNVGVGVVPSSWSTNRAIQVGIGAAFIGNTVFNATDVANNVYGNYTYLTSARATLYRQYTGDHQFFTSASGTAGNEVSFVQSMTLTSAPNLKLGGTAERATTVGTNHIDIYNGTAPAGTLANGISLYSNAGEAYVMDAAGNATLFSPHDSVTNEWIFRSKHTPTGKVLRIDVEKMLRFINDHFGLDMIQEFIEK